MRLEKLTLFNFRNYNEAQIEFQGDVLCLVGKNGSGKTNLLDAIYYLSFTKSSLNSSDAQNIRNGETIFSVKGWFANREMKSEVLCSYQSGQKKTVKENGTEYSRLSEHIGKYPVVLIAPGDIELIWDGSEIRRKFFDGLISQINKEYLENLIVYTSCLKLRNSALRHFSERNKVDYDLLESYDRKLIASAGFISGVRKEFVKQFHPLLHHHYEFLCNKGPEEASVNYTSELLEHSLGDLLKKNLSRDLALQRTSSGIHRDDFGFYLNGFELKRYGSQGQQKSFLIALKLSEFETIFKNKNFKPILLLDDVFDKLDDERIARLINLVGGGAFGQIFITDARPDRSRDLLRQAGISPELFLVENGNLTKTDGKEEQR